MTHVIFPSLLILAVTSPSYVFGCGRAREKGSTLPHNFGNQEALVVGGAEPQPHEFPWVAQLSYMGEANCGATLVAPSLAVTAAHCLKGHLISNLTLHTGGHKTLSGDRHNVTDIALHPLYWAPTSNYDIAVIKFSPPVTWSKKTQPICLPLLPVADYTKCIVAGWGDQTDRNEADEKPFEGIKSDTLRAAQVPIIPHFECKGFHSKTIDFWSMMCAGSTHGRIDSCRGDSGGPLMCQRGTAWELQGIVSFGGGCGRIGKPGVYTRVYSMLPFLNREMFNLR